MNQVQDNRLGNKCRASEARSPCSSFWRCSILNLNAPLSFWKSLIQNDSYPLTSKECQPLQATCFLNCKAVFTHFEGVLTPDEVRLTRCKAAFSGSRILGRYVQPTTIFYFRFSTLCSRFFYPNFYNWSLKINSVEFEKN